MMKLHLPVRFLGNNQTWDFEGDNCEYFEGDRKTNRKKE